MSVERALGDFIAAYQKTYPRLETEFDARWRSPCEIGEPFSTDDDSQRICWEPTARSQSSNQDDFAPLERALEVAVHPALKAYYGAYWSAGMEAEAVQGHVSLLFLWNEADIERLQENLIGHSLAKQRAKSSLSIFFACTEPDSELFLSIDNASGAILLEKPGYRPLRQVADCLESFLEELVPALVTTPG